MTLRISFFLILLLFAPLAAQSGGTLEVTSDPSGTTITLDGEFKLAGVTPTVFSQPLTGIYILKASREGYESYKTKVVLTGGSPLSVNIRLAPKTRFKAFIRSVVIPGWGQYYAGEKGRGIVFGITTLAVGLTGLVAQLDYADKRDAYDFALSEFAEERSIEKKKAMEDMVNLAREEAYDAESFRNITAGVIAAVWVYNLIDAVLFFPDKKYEAHVPRISLDTGKDFSKIGLAVNFSF
jgi:PEGA domain/Family of unknown function (DUF5683)